MDQTGKYRIANKTGWIILLDECKPYLDIVWKTKEEALNEYEYLLKPYSQNSIWRKRLSVSFWPFIKTKSSTQTYNIFNDYPCKSLSKICEDNEEQILTLNGNAPYGWYRKKIKLEQFTEDKKEQNIIKRILQYRKLYSIDIPSIRKKLIANGIKNRLSEYFSEKQILKILNRFNIDVKKENKNEDTKRNIHQIFDQYESADW